MSKIRYTKFGRKPRTALAALKQARAFLVAEGKQRWVKGTEFRTPNTAKTPFRTDDPLCGSWKVCSIGAVALVTGDMEVHHCGVNVLPSDTVSPTYTDAVKFLDRAAGPGGIVMANDRGITKRKDVIRYFDQAIALAERDAKARMGRRSTVNV